VKLLKPKKLPVYIFAIIIGFISIFPIYWMFATSLLPTSKLFLPSPIIFPSLDYFDAYKNLFTEIPLGKWLSNTGFIAVGCTVTSLLLAVFSAYALSRRKFRGKGLVGFVMFATQMLPEALLLIPLYSLFIALGLINSLYGLILANTAFVMPIIVWILKGAIDSVPIELEEAAIIDGCSMLKVQRKIIWPLIAPSIVASAVMAFFHAWNEYLFATTFILDPEKRAASTGLASLIGELATPLDRVMAASMIYTLPPLIFFLLIQKRIVSGLAAGSVKG
jgi:multiple sugar transport system permease protein